MSEFAVPDCSGASTQLDWADRQIDVLASEVRAFTSTNPYEVSSEGDTEGKLNVYLALKEPIPASFAANVAAIIQAQRSSLDYLAVALAEANGAVDPADTYFPIMKTLEGLSDKRTLKRISKLHPADQARIFALKPYEAGNFALYQLHVMNNERKHRRLGAMAADTRVIGLGAGPGGGNFYGMQAFKPDVSHEGRHLIATIHMDGEPKLDIAIAIGFPQIATAKGTPTAVSVLRMFNNLCRDTIDLFTNPSLDDRH